MLVIMGYLFDKRRLTLLSGSGIVCRYFIDDVAGEHFELDVWILSVTLQ
jgi:hypothetical protein